MRPHTSNFRLNMFKELPVRQIIQNQYSVTSQENPLPECDRPVSMQMMSTHETTQLFQHTSCTNITCVEIRPRVAQLEHCPNIIHEQREMQNKQPNGWFSRLLDLLNEESMAFLGTVFERISPAYYSSNVLLQKHFPSQQSQWPGWTDLEDL